MRILQQDKKTCAIASINGETLLMNVSLFDRTNYGDNDDIFRDINGYLAWLSANRRKRIWDIYVAMNEALKGIDNISVLTPRLAGYVEALYNEVPLEELDHWLRFHGNMVYPEGIKTERDPDDPMPIRTYIKSEYHDLIVLATALRLMVPIWGAYIYLIRNHAGTYYKEYIAMRLLSRSAIIESKAMLRLQAYIECFVTPTSDLKSAIIAGLSATEIPVWLLSMIVIRRMAVGEVDAEDRNSMITNIHRFVDSTIKDLPNRFGNVREKYPEDDDNDESSILECYRVKETMTAGEMMTFNVYTQYITRMVKGVDPSVPDAYIHACASALQPLDVMQIVKPHVVLVQWVLQNIMSPHAIPGLNKQALLRAMGATQAILWHWGFLDLALLCTAQVMPSEQSLQMSDSRTRVPTTLVDKLAEYYPHLSQRGGATGRGQNVAYASVTALTREYISRSWQATSHSLLISQTPGSVESNGQVIIPPTLTEQLIRLVIRLNEQ